MLSLSSRLIEKIKLKYNPLSVSLKSKHPSNQFLMTGFIGLRQAAGQKQNKNLAHILKFAIKGLQKYPIPIIHPEQALDLNGLGPSLLKQIHNLFYSNHIQYKNLKNPSKSSKKNNFIDLSDIKIQLYVDLRETRGNNLTSLIENLQINYSLKTLALGDYIFIAETPEKKIVLDIIIERKSSSDLNSSHFSNHLRDQIRRLKICTIPLKVLLIEGKVNYEILAEM